MVLANNTPKLVSRLTFANGRYYVSRRRRAVLNLVLSSSTFLFSADSISFFNMTAPREAAPSSGVSRRLPFVFILFKSYQPNTCHSRPNVRYSVACFAPRKQGGLLHAHALDGFVCRSSAHVDPMSAFSKKVHLCLSFAVPSRFSNWKHIVNVQDNCEGNEVLELLRKAFERRVTFTIGTSITTGVWKRAFLLLLFRFVLFCFTSYIV